MSPVKCIGRANGEDIIFGVPNPSENLAMKFVCIPFDDDVERDSIPGSDID